MAHFAELDSENIVQRVIIVADEDCGGAEFPLSEQLGQEFIASLGLAGVWKQTSASSEFRKQYAGVGYRYDVDADVFVTPQPYPSWTLDLDHNWQPPTPHPTGEAVYIWDENTMTWVEKE